MGGEYLREMLNSFLIHELLHETRQSAGITVVRATPPRRGLTVNSELKRLTLSDGAPAAKNGGRSHHQHPSRAARHTGREGTRAAQPRFALAHWAREIRSESFPHLLGRARPAHRHHGPGGGTRGSDGVRETPWKALDCGANAERRRYSGTTPSILKQTFP